MDALLFIPVCKFKQCVSGVIQMLLDQSQGKLLAAVAVCCASRATLTAAGYEEALACANPGASNKHQQQAEAWSTFMTKLLSSERTEKVDSPYHCKGCLVCTLISCAHELYACNCLPTQCQDKSCRHEDIGCISLDDTFGAPFFQSDDKWQLHRKTECHCAGCSEAAESHSRHGKVNPCDRSCCVIFNHLAKSAGS